MTDNNIQEIRTLLNLYYEAQTSPEQERVLADFFMKAESIPDDLKDDARLFRAMAAQADKVVVPEGFEQRLISATCGKAKSKRLPRILYWTSAAAAAIVIAVIVVRWQPEQQSQPQPVPAVEPIAEAPIVAEVLAAPVDTAEDAVPAAYIAQNEKPAKQTVPKPAEAEPSPYIEIASADSAATVVRDVLGRLGSALACADKATTLPMEVIDNTLTTTINTLQK